MSNSNLPPFAALRAFVAIGNRGGIRKAADALGVSHAIVSRHLSGLEQWFAAILMDRATGQLTPEGLAYHQSISKAIAEMEAATERLHAGKAMGLTIWCSPGFALHWLTKRLHGFAGGRNRPVIDLRSTDTEPALERGEADGDICYLLDSARMPLSRNLRLLELARPPVFPVAAPQLLDRLKTPIRTASDFLELPLIQERDDGEWRAWLEAQGLTGAALKAPVARYGQAHLTLAAARAGQGIALSNPFLAAEDLDAGRVRAILSPDHAFEPVPLGAYVFRAARARWSDGALTRFRTWLKSAIEADERPSGLTEPRPSN